MWKIPFSYPQSVGVLIEGKRFLHNIENYKELTRYLPKLLALERSKSTAVMEPRNEMFSHRGQGEEKFGDGKKLKSFWEAFKVGSGADHSIVRRNFLLKPES
jgi:hypothetical protein